MIEFKNQYIFQEYFCNMHLNPISGIHVLFIAWDNDMGIGRLLFSIKNI